MSRSQRTTAAVVMAAAALLLAACTPGSASNPGAAANPGTSDVATPSEDAGSAAPVTIQYATFSANAGNEENLQAMIDAFEAAHPNITIDAQIFPYGDYFTTLQTAIAGGTVADTFELNYESFAQYASAGALTPITDLPEGVYQDSLLQGFQRDGEQLGLPLSYSDIVLIYNPDLFAAAGIEPPTADWTWQDETAAATTPTRTRPARDARRRDMGPRLGGEHKAQLNGARGATQPAGVVGRLIRTARGRPSGPWTSRTAVSASSFWAAMSARASSPPSSSHHVSAIQ